MGLKILLNHIMCGLYIYKTMYVYIHTHTHIHTYIYTHIYIYTSGAMNPSLYIPWLVDLDILNEDE